MSISTGHRGNALKLSKILRAALSSAAHKKSNLRIFSILKSLFSKDLLLSLYHSISSVMNPLKCEIFISRVVIVSNYYKVKVGL